MSATEGWTGLHARIGRAAIEGMDIMDEGIEVMPAPTDGEIREAVHQFELATGTLQIAVASETWSIDKEDVRNEALTHLLRLIAQREAAARKEALEDAMRAIDADIPDEPNAGIAFVIAEKGAKRARFIVSSLLTQEDTADE